MEINDKIVLTSGKEAVIIKKLGAKLLVVTEDGIVIWIGREDTSGH